MENSKDYIATTIRVPGPMLEKIKKLASEIGDSQNGVMLHLIFMGMKVYEGKIGIAPSGCQDAQNTR